MIERHSKLVAVVTVWLSFLLVSLTAAPIPAVNEPHYLAKARHFHDSAWCAGDLFLESFPAHRVFYETFGWLTLWFDFATVAIIGRVVSLAMLALSWTALISRLQQSTATPSGDEKRDEPSSGFSTTLLSAWLFVGLQAVGNLSGEWLIRGFESKVIAYAFVFWSAAAMLDRRLLTAAICSGIAVSFHPLVGVWHAVASGLAVIGTARWWLPIWRRVLVALLLVLLTSLPGLLPVLDMLKEAKPKDSFAANYIQVFYRLKHHLDPMDFGGSHFVGYGVLAVIWLAAMVWLIRTKRVVEQDRWWAGYLLATALFAVGGLLAGYGPRPAQLMAGYRWRMALLKFYPFRLFDLMLPLAVATVLPRLIRHRSLWLVGFVGLGWAMLSDRVFPPPNQLPPAMRADWLDACRWCSANTPSDAVFHTPFEAEAFKWFAQRAEYVNFKDCPQDAANLVEWNRRLKFITTWSEKSFYDDETYSAAELRELVRRTKVRWAITRTRVRYDVPPADLLYSNDTYKILRLPAAD